MSRLIVARKPGESSLFRCDAPAIPRHYTSRPCAKRIPSAAFSSRCLPSDFEPKKKVNATITQLNAILKLQKHLAHLKGNAMSNATSSEFSPVAVLLPDKKTLAAVARVSEIPDYNFYDITVRQLLMEIKSTAGVSPQMKEAINKALNLSD